MDSQSFTFDKKLSTMEFPEFKANLLHQNCDKISKVEADCADSSSNNENNQV